MTELSAKKRAELPAKDFGLPEKARTKAAKKESGNYPMPDKAQARNAKSRAAQQQHAGKLTKRERERSTGKRIAYSTTSSYRESVPIKNSGAFAISSPVGYRKAGEMAKETVEVLVDNRQIGGPKTVRLGWNGDWRKLELSRRNVSSLTKALDKYWAAGRPVTADGQPVRGRRSRATTPSRGTQTARNPRSIHIWRSRTGLPYRLAAASPRTWSASTTKPTGARNDFGHEGIEIRRGATLAEP